MIDYGSIGPSLQLVDLVYRFTEPDFWISVAVGGHVTSNFAKCWYHQNTLGLISTLPEARS